MPDTVAIFANRNFLTLWLVGLIDVRALTIPGVEDMEKKIEVDICPDCFDKHILGLLESLGVEIKWEEYDY